MFAQDYLAIVRAVLAATVAMENAAPRRGPQRNGHFQRPDRQIAFHAITDGPTGHAPGVQNQNDRQIMPTLEELGCDDITLHHSLNF